MDYKLSDHSSNGQPPIKEKKIIPGSQAFTSTLGAIDKKRLKNLKVIASKRQRATSNADIAEVDPNRTNNSSM
jgi:hypothetical protein